MNRPKKEISGSVSVSWQDDKEFQLCMAEAIKIVERNCELIEDGQRLLDRWQSIGKLDGHQFADIISEAMETQQQLRTLLEMGEMDKEEAEHAISNAEQVILFAQAAMKRDGN